MTRPIQKSLPGFPTLKEWMAEWIEEHYPDGPFPWIETRDQMRGELPWRFVPSADKQLEKWWVGVFQNTTKALGHRRFIKEMEDEEPTVVGALDEQLTLLDLLDTLTGSLVLGRQDIDAVKTRLVKWNTVNPGEITDVDGLFSEMLESVGLSLAEEA